MLALLSVSSEVQIIAYGPADATATRSSLASLKSRMVLPFWWRLTQIVLGNRPLNECLSQVSKFIYKAPFKQTFQAPLTSRPAQTKTSSVQLYVI